MSEPLVIVGAGPAGMSAAIEAAACGIHCLVIDENLRPGGQIYRQAAPSLVLERPPSSSDHRGRKLLAEYGRAGHAVRSVTGVVVGVFPPRRLLVADEQAVREVSAGALVLATGAYERPVPLPGWTLPGVYGAGGAQHLVKTQGVLPGRRVILSGTGPLQLVVASELAAAGAHVLSVNEAAHAIDYLALLRLCLSHTGLMWEGLGYLRALWRRHIPFRRGHAVVEVRGDQRVEEVVVARLDDQWRPLPERRETVACDAVCFGFGLVCSSELARMAGVEHRYNVRLGGWVPTRVDNMSTNVPGVFVAGDCAGIAGAQVAETEGRLAGMSAAEYLGGHPAPRRVAAFREKLAGMSRFRLVLDEISEVRPGLMQCVTEMTTVCRCEEVSWAQVLAAVRDGSRTLAGIKARTRAGMGYCQGRMCAPGLVDLLREHCGVEAVEVGEMTPRPPIRPVPMSLLATIEAGL
jgi:NADPH-dependent 2,4-dienoyl-CoA reductase/sulfur reductase-like enzyme